MRDAQAACRRAHLLELPEGTEEDPLRECLLADERRLGTAYGLMTMLQNIGLTVCNVGAGALNDHNKAGAANPGGYLPMLWMFALLSLAGIVFAELLRRRESGPHGHGLETLKVKGL